MTELPHDFADLYLAPVALAVDGRISALGTLDDEKLAVRVGLASDEPDWTVELRKDALLRTVGQLIELHGWEMAWDERGIRLSHGKHAVVLGVPGNFARYVERSTSI